MNKALFPVRLREARLQQGYSLDQLVKKAGRTLSEANERFNEELQCYQDGKIVTIRLANHNATVSNFDYSGRDNGISIVISPKHNNSITNDGYAHVVEYYYDSIKLRKAGGKPLACSAMASL